MRPMARKLSFVSALIMVLPLYGGCGDDTGGGPVCGNGVVEIGEACDASALGGQDCASLGLGTGTLTCTEACTLDTSQCTGGTTCGNGVQEGDEDCDGTDLADATCDSLGFGTGTLACSGTCGFDLSGCSGGDQCGDGVIQSPEECDGSDLAGATCESLGLGVGTLTCADNCSLITTACTLCGNGTCDATANEDCSTCPADCGLCSSCGDDTCDTAAGEDCSTCPQDCQVRPGQVCCDGTVYHGDCCTDDDCAPYGCMDHQCVHPACDVFFQYEDAGTGQDEPPGGCNCRVARSDSAPDGAGTIPAGPLPWLLALLVVLVVEMRRRS